MKLSELSPVWLHASPDRKGQGFSFVYKGRQFLVFFKNPLDGGPPIFGQYLHERTGDTFDDMSLSECLNLNGHAFQIYNGETTER
jgi:hypothetical protein